MEVSVDKLQREYPTEIVSTGDPEMDKVRENEIARIKASRNLVEKVIKVEGVPYGGDKQGHMDVVTVPGPDDFWYEGQV